MVTNRLPAMNVDGKRIWHIGFPIHWGYAAAKGHEGPLANFLTPSAGDPNVWTRRHTVTSSSPLTARSASQERSDAVLTHTPRHRDLLPWCP